MPAEELIFDPEGDISLHLHLPADYSYFSDYEAKRPAVEAEDATSIEQSEEDPSTSAPTSDIGTLDAPSVLVKEEGMEFEMLVSSKRLMLASPVFKAIFESHLLEGQLLKKRRTDIHLPDDDPKAIIILLGAIHGPPDKIPQKISLRTLVQLSVLVDKYEALESIKPYVEAWIVDLWRPGKLTRSDVLAWLSIFWVFQVKKCFEDLSKVVQRQMTSQLRTEVLPIPRGVLGAIEASRRHSIGELIAVLHRMITDYSSGEVQCTSTFGSSSHLSTSEKREACDSLILGSLIRNLSRHGVWPLPQHPYNGINLTQLAKIVRDLKMVGVCKQILYTTTRPTPMDAHGLMKILKDEADRIDGEACGLDFGSLVAGIPKFIVYVTEVKDTETI